MTTQSEAAPHEVVFVEPSPRAGATAIVMVPDPAPSSPDPDDTPMTVEQRLQTIAGLASRGVAGVHGLGDAGSNGVKVEVGEHQTAIEVSLVLDYGASVVAVSRTVRRKVIQAVERDTGLQVTEVNVIVTDVHLPGGRPVGSLGGWPE